jgi:1,2-diacylglycerol 3-alpha-glucosyltransferase
MRLAISFTNFGPYHRARLRALGEALAQLGGELIAYETAGRERRYPWEVEGGVVPFVHRTLLPDRVLEGISAGECARAMTEALECDRPDAVALCGYVRPEVRAALHWAERRRVPRVLMSESQAIDKPRVWWKESVKGRRVRRFGAALVGGTRHRDYLATLGLHPDRVVLGYNAVDNERFAALADARRTRVTEMPERPYFLAVSRFVPEKNLLCLIDAYALYRRGAAPYAPVWDLALCGHGSEGPTLDAHVRALQLDDYVLRPGFLQDEELAGWYAQASAFVHPSRMEPWGLVVNEAAACGLPLLVSRRAGCVETLVPEPEGTTGRRFDPDDLADLIGALSWMASHDEQARRAMGERARDIVAEWGPRRFAHGMLEALELAAHTTLNGHRDPVTRPQRRLAS